MSAVQPFPILRARCAEALAALLGREAHTTVAQWLGVAQTTVSRRGAELGNWPADELLVLAGHDCALRTALGAYLAGSAVGCCPSTVERLLSRDIADSAGSIALANAILADGNADRRELAQWLPTAERQYEHLGQSIEAARAKLRGVTA